MAEGPQPPHRWHHGPNHTNYHRVPCPCRAEAGVGTRGAVHSKRGPARTHARHHRACAAADSTRRPTCTLRVNIFQTKAERAPRVQNEDPDEGAGSAWRCGFKRRLNLRVFGAAWLSVCGRWCVFVRSSAIAHASADRARASRRMSRVCSTGRWALGYSQDGGGKAHSHGLMCVPSKAAVYPQWGGVLARPLVTDNPTQNVHI